MLSNSVIMEGECWRSVKKPSLEILKAKFFRLQDRLFFNSKEKSFLSIPWCWVIRAGSRDRILYVLDKSKDKKMPFLKSGSCYGANRSDAHEEEYEKGKEFRRFPVVHGHLSKRTGHVCHKRGESASAADTAVLKIQVSHPRNIRAPWSATSMGKGQ